MPWGFLEKSNDSEAQIDDSLSQNYPILTRTWVLKKGEPNSSLIECDRQ